jgi:hypothetical protein
MTRGGWVGLETAEVIVLRGRGRVAARSEDRPVAADCLHRRAALEEALLVAYAAGDREHVSRLRGELAQLEADA